MLKKLEAQMMKIYDHQHRVLVLLGKMTLWMIIVGTIFSVPDHVLAMESDSKASNSSTRIHMAAQAVDEAWKEFHRSAIEGTLASPSIQSQIEQQLHEARALLMEARRGERKSDHTSVMSITDKVIDLSKMIVASSLERKK